MPGNKNLPINFRFFKKNMQSIAVLMPLIPGADIVKLRFFDYVVIGEGEETLPDETEEDQLETLDLIKWLTGKGGKVHSHYFMPLPGTAFENSIQIKA